MAKAQLKKKLGSRGGGPRIPHVPNSETLEAMAEFDDPNLVPDIMTYEQFAESIKQMVREIDEEKRLKI